MEPHLTLAFALRSNPGAYALLVGAGVSMSSGVPSAWGVQEQLIRVLARAQGEEPADPFAWYQDWCGKPSAYDDLLAALTHTPEERQALLRGFFEPTAEEREDGLKTPTPAHRAVARLVSAGLVKIILTINFDRLTETALRDEGIEPTVVVSPSDIAGLAPLHTVQCLVVHVHGDYLSPSSMLNTAEELGSYPPELNGLLDRVFDEYGLVIAGWSAAWDAALRNALTRCPIRRFATYWIDPRPLGDRGADLRAQRQATWVQSSADDFFGQLADACEALDDIERPHPKTVEVAVATAKRALAGRRTAIPLHDTIKQELDRVRSLDVVATTNFNGSDAVHGRRLAELESGMEIALALIATAAYWGDQSTDWWWFDDIERFTRFPKAGGTTTLIRLVQAPATMIIHAAGVAAVGCRRWPLVARLLTEPTTIDPLDGNRERLAAHLLDPAETLSVPRASQRLCQCLGPLFTEHLALGDTGYTEAWERFEYLRVVTQEDQKLQGAPGSSAQLPHIRADGHLNAYRPVPAAWLRREIARLGPDHPLLKAGLADGSSERLLAAAHSYDTDFGRYASEAAWGAQANIVVTMPNDPWYPAG